MSADGRRAKQNRCLPRLPLPDVSGCFLALYSQSRAKPSLCDKSVAREIADLSRRRAPLVGPAAAESRLREDALSREVWDSPVAPTFDDILRPVDDTEPVPCQWSLDDTQEKTEPADAACCELDSLPSCWSDEHSQSCAQSEAPLCYSPSNASSVTLSSLAISELSSITAFANGPPAGLASRVQVFDIAEDDEDDAEEEYFPGGWPMGECASDSTEEPPRSEDEAEDANDNYAITSISKETVENGPCRPVAPAHEIKKLGALPALVTGSTAH